MASCCSSPVSMCFLSWILVIWSLPVIGATVNTFDFSTSSSPSTHSSSFLSSSTLSSSSTHTSSNSSTSTTASSSISLSTSSSPSLSSSSLSSLLPSSPPSLSSSLSSPSSSTLSGVFSSVTYTPPTSEDSASLIISFVSSRNASSSPLSSRPSATSANTSSGLPFSTIILQSNASATTAVPSLKPGKGAVFSSSNPRLSPNSGGFPITVGAQNRTSDRFGPPKALLGGKSNFAGFNASFGNHIFNGSIGFPQGYSNWTGNIPSGLFSSCSSVYHDYYTSLQHAWFHTLPFSMTYSRAAECEEPLAKYCLIWVDGVDLLYWPTPYAKGVSPATGLIPRQDVESSFVSDDFPFTTGSAYLVYKNAKAILPFNTKSSTTGPFYSSLTIGYPEKSLSTFYNCNPSGFWPAKSIDFEDFNQPPRWRVVSEQRPCHVWSIEGDSMQHRTFPLSHIATDYSIYSNQPLVLLPGPLDYIDPAWRTCSMGDAGLGLYDPPRPLRPVDALTPAITTAAPALAQESAQPASVVASAGPKPTGITVHLPNGDTIVDYPPAGASLNVPVQSSGSPSSTGIVVANRPLPFNPSKPASPQQGGSGGSSGGKPANAVQAGSQPKSGLDTQDQLDPPTQVATVDSNYQSGSQPNKPNEADQHSPVLAPVAAGSNPKGNSSPPNMDVASPGASQDIAEQPQQQPSPINVGGHQIQAAPQAGVVVDGATLASASPSTTVHGVQLSLHSSGVIVGGNTLSVPQPGPGGVPTPVSVNGHDVQVNQGPAGDKQLIVDGKTVAAGVSQAHVGDNVISVLDNGQLSVLPTTLPYVPLPTNQGNPASGTQTQAPAPYRLPDGTVKFADSIITPGSPPSTISGTPVSVLPDGQAVVIGQKTIQPIPTVPPAIGSTPLGIVINGEILTPVAGGGVALEGTTLSKAGQSLTLRDGKIASIASGNLMVGTQTLPIPSLWSPLKSPLTPLTINGQTFTPLDHGSLVMDGTTLSRPGQSITLKNDEVATLQSGALVVGSSTILLPSPEATLHSIAHPPNGLVIVDNSLTFTPVGSTGIAFAGSTISTAGQSLKLPGGSLITLASDGAFVMDAQTMPLTQSASHGVGWWVANGMVGDTFTTLSDGNVAIDGVTLSPGGSAATLSDGEILSLAPSTDSKGDIRNSMAAIMTFSGTARPVSVVRTDGSSTIAPGETSTLTPPSSGDRAATAAAVIESGGTSAAASTKVPQLVTPLLCVFAACIAMGIPW